MTEDLILITYFLVMNVLQWAYVLITYFTDVHVGHNEVILLCSLYEGVFLWPGTRKENVNLKCGQMLDKLTESMNYDFRYGRLNLKQMISKLRQNNLVSSFSRWLLRRMWSFFVIFDSNVLLLIMKKKKKKNCGKSEWQ